MTGPAHRHPDFANVVRVARFHQAPRRVQYLGLVDRLPANVVVLPMIRGPRLWPRPCPYQFDVERFRRDLAEAADALKDLTSDLPCDCEPAPA